MRDCLMAMRDSVLNMKSDAVVLKTISFIINKKEFLGCLDRCIGQNKITGGPTGHACHVVVIDDIILVNLLVMSTRKNIYFYRK